MADSSEISTNVDVEMKGQDSEEEGENNDEQMKSNEDSASDSGSESDNEQNERHIAELEKQISKNPYLYDVHVELIKLLKEQGELDHLRNARQKMCDFFPLSEDLWLDWLKDETTLIETDDDRKKVEDLFQRAVKDYLSVKIWLEYIQFSIGGMASQDGISKIREVCEKALSAAGLHVTQGSCLWEAYREFENAILMGTMPAPGQVATKQQEADFDVQHKKMMSLFKRQLSLPLNDMEETFAEYKEWLQDEIDKQLKQQFDKALDKYKKLLPFENDILSKEDKAEKKSVYLEYIEYEKSHGTASRVISLYERLICEYCLDDDVWIKYTNYLNFLLNDDTLCIPAYERSVRNCPWCSQLWSDYILMLERSKKSRQEIKETVDRALSCGFSEGGSYLQIWSTYCDYLRRRIAWDKEHEEALSLFRANIEKAVEHLYSIPDSDPMGSLRQFWANIEAKYCKNVTKGRELWNEIMTEGHGSEAVMWLNFYQFERCYGDNKHCRKLLQRALNSVSDWPESIVDAYINFEREEGDLEQYEVAVHKCTSQMDRVKERRKLAAEKEEQKGAKKQHKQFDRGDNLKIDNKKLNKGKKWKQNKNEQVGQGVAEVEVKPYQKRDGNQSGGTQVINGAESSENGSKSVKRKADEGPEFKVPVAPPPGFKGQKSKNVAPPPGFKVQKSKVAPPPGFKGETENDVEPPAKVQKTESHDQEHVGGGDTGHMTHDKSSCTAFVSNLSYDLDEDKIKEVFSKYGEIVEVRLVKTYKGKSKGYAYVEFKDELSVIEALKFDRSLVEGRPVYVSKCEEKSARKPQFKFSTDMEKNKLFIKNLPFTCTKEALSNIFSQHGTLKDVRLVTYRNGVSKGLAYVEYVDEQSAAQAVLKTDGLMIGEHAISVAISNPPQRKMPLKDEEFVPSLGGGKKETEMRGKARTQVALLPRALKPSATPTAVRGPSKTDSKSDTKSESHLSTNYEASGKSNDDFRKMLLGGK